MIQMTSLPQENKYHSPDRHTLYAQPARVSILHNEPGISEDC